MGVFHGWTSNVQWEDSCKEEYDCEYIKYITYQLVNTMLRLKRAT